MSTKERLLALLITHQGDWVSGEQIAQRLAITRAAIWKTVKSLQHDGYAVDSRRGLGYCYHDSDKMSALGIQQHLTLPIAVQMFDTIDSTNVYAKQELIAGRITEPTAIIANQMTAGVGRFGRHFYSPANTGLYITIALPVSPGTVLNPGLLTTSTAVIVGDILEGTFGCDCRFKWVNDLIVRGKKVGGILTEAMTDFESAQTSAIVTGIGVNLAPPKEAFPAELQDKIGTVLAAPSTKPLPRNRLVAEILSAFLRMYASYDDGRYLERYRERVLGVGQQITVQQGKQMVTGEMTTVDDNGHLVMRVAGESYTVASGEITKVTLPESLYRG